MISMSETIDGQRVMCGAHVNLDLEGAGRLIILIILFYYYLIRHVDQTDFHLASLLIITLVQISWSDPSISTCPSYD